MSMNDPIADMLTRIRNAVARKFDRVCFPASNHKREILNVLKNEGYIEDFETVGEPPKTELNVVLKYGSHGEPVITRIRRISKTGCRIYTRAREIRPVLGGLGIRIISTPKGVMSDREAWKNNVGGEVIAEVY